jgi:SpoVK/Ycf46/Vps4 family AAA+-type ATPase
LMKSIVSFVNEHPAIMRSFSLMWYSFLQQVTGNMKAGFMTRWDGLTTEDDTRIIVLGATNLPNALDPAVLRRLPKRYAVGLPKPLQRRKIFEILLKKASLATDLSIDRLVRATEGYSGSDIKEMCRNAAMIPLREYLQVHGKDLENRCPKTEFEMRPLTTRDFLFDIEKDVQQIGEEEMD